MFEMIVTFCLLVEGQRLCSKESSGANGALYASQSECRRQASIAHKNFVAKVRRHNGRVEAFAWVCIPYKPSEET